MSFPWWESKIPEDYRATFPKKLETMLVEETKRRAQILYSLGFGLSEALTRVRAYLRWDYEVGMTPAAVAKLDAVVGEVYGRRAGRAAEAAPAVTKALPAPKAAKTEPSKAEPAKPEAAKLDKKADKKAEKKAGKKLGKKR